eukprot:TRINITY_DN10659_c0_g1_i1.p1 TRINITY_DN10659_c0_g1~~TRINITY_DN10659_c0_g1_i1.p1  ORF type:complete len:464 (+),score=73.13 TRINITY_DN10659_c0_g1_i1:383-1774(+)
MKLYITRLVVLFLAIVLTKGLDTIPPYARGGIAWEIEKNDVVVTDAQLFKQVVNHFANDSADEKLFDQRFYEYTDDYTDGPVFLYICGEAPCSGAAGYVLYLAKKYNGAAVALEHRFYGKSVPNDNLEANNLQLLTVEQALADLNYFITEHIHKKLHNTKVVMIGGSYSGGLSSWFRQVYKDITCAHLSSSGVVNAIFDFHQFDERVSIAAGSECSSVLISAMKGMEEMYDQGHSIFLKTLFNAEHLTEVGDFFYMVADSSAMAIQYGHKDYLCDNLKLSNTGNITKLIVEYAHLTKELWGDDFGGSCFYDTNCLLSDREHWQPTSRAWRWQKCTQLAYFQSAPDNNTIRSYHVDLEYMLGQCSTIFGSETISNTDNFNNKYGGDKPKTTNVFYSDFIDDPWQEASVKNSISNTQPFVLVDCDDCGHCRDLKAPGDKDPNNLKKERLLFEKDLSNWVKKCNIT